MALFVYSVGATVVNATVTYGGALGAVTLAEAGTATVGAVLTGSGAFIGLGGTLLAGAVGLEALAKGTKRFLVSRCPPDLKKYTVNFNEQFKIQRDRGELHPSAFNRQGEVVRIESVLSSRNNAAIFLHGPAGVGKTAIVEQVVYRHITGQSKILEGYTFLKLEHNKLLAFSLEKGIWEKFKAEFLSNGVQGELNKIFEALTKGKYILFIDEADEIIKSEFFEKKLEELARGQVKLIFATTTDLMKKCTHSWDPAMRRRIPLMEIKEFNVDQMIDALKEGRTEYEDMYGVTYDEDALAAVVALATNIVDEKFPHKAVNLLGTISNAIKAANGNVKPHITKEAVIKNYALLYDADISNLTAAVNKMILNLTPEKMAPYFQVVDQENKVYPKSVKEAFEKARFCFTSGISTLLIEPSNLVQSMLMQYFAKDRPIIPISIRQLSTLYSQLSPKNQKIFLEYFNDLCEPKNGKKPLFYIQDSESFLAVATHNTVQPTQNKDSNVSVFKVKIDKEMDELKEALGAFNVNIPHLNKLRDLPNFEIPNLSSSANNNNNNVSRSNTYAESLRKCPFVQNLLAKLRSKEAVVMVSTEGVGASLGEGITYRLQTMEALRYHQMLDLLATSYSDIDRNVVSQVLVCAAILYGRKYVVDIAGTILMAIQEDKKSQPSDVIKQKLIQLGKDVSTVETILHQHTYLEQQLAFEIDCAPDASKDASPAALELLKVLAESKTKMNFLTIDEKDRNAFVEKMTAQIPTGSHLYHLSTEALGGCTLSKAFQQELILEELVVLESAIIETKPVNPVFVIDVPFTKLDDKIAAQIEKMVTLYGMKAVYFCSKEEIEVRKAVQEAAPASPSIYERIAVMAIGQIFKKEAEKEEEPYKFPAKLCEQSRRIVQINVNDEDYRKAHSISARISQFFYSITIQPVMSVIGFGQRSVKALFSPLSQMDYSTAWISLSFLSAKQ